MQTLKEECRRAIANDEWCQIEDEADFVVNNVMGWCGCGMPNDAAEFLLKALRHMERRTALLREGSSKSYDEWSKRVQVEEDSFSTDDGYRMFVYYVLHQAGLEEHGGAVPGWLSERGFEVLELLEKWKREADEEEEFREDS